MRRKKVGSKLDEINLEESKLVANNYKKNRVFELHLQKKIVGGIYRNNVDISSEMTVKKG